MKRAIYGIIFLLVLSRAVSADKVYNPFPLSVDAYSSSYEYGSFSLMLNPVFTDSSLSPNLAYRYINTDRGSTQLALLNLFGFALHYSFYDSVYDHDYDTSVNAGTGIFGISRGFIFDNTFGFGIGYTAGLSGKDEYNGYSGWNAGLLFRPCSILSFGISFRDLNGKLDGHALEVTRDYSVSVRPFGENFTLSADCYIGSAANEGDPFYSFSGEIKAWRNITLSIRGDTMRNYTAGIIIPLDMRFSSPVNISPDFYGSNNGSGPGFYSAGATVRFRHESSINVGTADNLLYITLAESFAENGRTGYLIESKPEFLTLISGIMQAADDQTISGIVVEMGELNADFAQIQEIRSALKHFRGKGKRLYMMMNSSGNREYYLASCADVIYFTPNSEFAINALSTHVYFIKGLLDMAGIKFESIRRGDYKSFNDHFTRNEMSPEVRSNLNEVLTDLNEQFISGITERNRISREKVEELFRAGSYTPGEAAAKGFIDEVMYKEDMVDSFSDNTHLVSFEDYCSETRIVNEWGPAPVIAVVYVTGTIVDGEGSQDGISGSTGNYDYSMALEAAFEDNNVKGIVIRVDSGGGSASASDFMWKTLVYLKKKYPKPVVFSFGNMAASGGYYIACTGDRIFAENGTITGSIGVIAGKISVKELYARLGINRESISLSEFADIYDESKPLTENEYRVLDRQTGFIYDRFTQKVIEARYIQPSEIEKIAGGRVHSGRAAMNNRLIDEEGGIFAAIEFCKTKSCIEGMYRIVQFPDNSSILPGFSDLLSGSSYAGIDIFIRNMQAFRMLDGQALYLQPYIIEIE